MYDLRDYIKLNYSDILINKILTKDGEGSGWICPFCGSGSGLKGTGLKKDPHKLPENLYTCFGSCDKQHDIITLWAKVCNLDVIEDFKEILMQMSDEVGLNVEFEGKQITTQNAGLEKPKQTNNTVKKKELTPEEMKLLRKQNSKYIEECKNVFVENSPAMKYCKEERGFNVEGDFELLKALNIGYDISKNEIIIQTGDISFGAYERRSLNPLAKIKKANAENIESHFYREELLEELKHWSREEPPRIFICEGFFDCLSFEAIGLNAISLNGLNKNKFLEKALEIQKQNKNAQYILAFDKDEPGRKAEAELLEKLEVNYIGAFSAISLLSVGKDVNDNFKDNREEFTKQAKELFIIAGEEIKKKLKESQKEYYNTRSRKRSIEALYIDSLNRKKEVMPSGFPKLDKILDDGFYPGLYILGAGSSVGKTSFGLQIADNIAQQKKDVIIFSLEQSQKELTAKTLSRLTYINKGFDEKAKSTHQILVNYAENIKSEIVTRAKNIFCSFCNNQIIYEGVGNYTVNDIRERINEHIKATGNIPFVFIDYIQIISSLDVHLSDKQATDKNITELKRISRDFNCPILGISSLNRESYNSSISMTAFKESGSIEYGSDVLMGLQFAGLLDDKEKNKENNNKIREEIRKQKENGEPVILELKILKNRNGIQKSTGLKSIYRYNYFEDWEEEMTADNCAKLFSL